MASACIMGSTPTTPTKNRSDPIDTITKAMFHFMVSRIPFSKEQVVFTQNDSKNSTNTESRSWFS